MQSVAGFVFDRLRGKIRAESVVSCGSFNDSYKIHGVVGGGHSITVAEVDFVLPRAAAVVRAFRCDTHILERQADLAAHVFPLVVGSYVHVSRVVERYLGRLSVLVGFEKVEFVFRAELYTDSHFVGVRHCFFEESARVFLKNPSVGVFYVAEHPYNLAVRRSPRKYGESRRDGKEQKIRFSVAVV